MGNDYKCKLIYRKQTNKGDKSSKETKERKLIKNIKPKYGPMPTFPNQRLFARGVMISAALIIVYYTSNTTKETILAKQKDVIPGRGHNVDCSKEYRKELDVFPECVPVKCGRFVSDRLVTESEADTLLNIGKRGLNQGSAAGGASILDLHTGAVTKGTVFINIYSLNNLFQLFSVHDFTTYSVVRTKIQHAIANQFGISADSLYLTYPTFFSRLTEKPAVTLHDEYWHAHVDKETYETFHYTSLLYLNDYGADFLGGRFIFKEPDNSSVVIEPKKGTVLMYFEKGKNSLQRKSHVSMFTLGKEIFTTEKTYLNGGRVSMFTSGKENLHHIERVTSGVRYALTVSFTCNKKYAIKDPTVPALS